jgi:hypothetical protein
MEKICFLSFIALFKYKGQRTNTYYCPCLSMVYGIVWHRQGLNIIQKALLQQDKMYLLPYLTAFTEQIGLDLHIRERAQNAREGEECKKIKGQAF